ncbi:Transcriptional corepressor LEUNIG [Hibiscus syriacus]|uniref:Transcriptional corepressor LEUNIG n=1 Tax=Hibiscus syriacus TaxID=106335 RepID=A0A6A3CTJ2_HIBSY|nr:E3 ubiquitin-protein ligase PRT1-like [Hibiscus syriacus]KAE8731877.1 Transcriptional corepressor LEUNIG [Hibiscus syriacus]
MEKQGKIDANIDGTLIEPLKHHQTHNQQQQQAESTHHIPSEEFLDEFKCCVCLELLFKPVVLACGHMSCFWCVYSAMNHVHESHCPICWCPYNHFPGVCQLLHFLLLKLYPIAYNRRERQVREEEKAASRFSLQFDQNLLEPKLCGKSYILGNNNIHSHLQMDEHSKSGYMDSESSSFIDAPKTIMQAENGVPIKPMPFSESPDADASNQEKTSLSYDSEHKDQKVVSVPDLLCAACNRLLVRPVVLNCGHVYCESCFVIPNDEMPRCQVCKSSQPNGFPGVCLILHHFLENQFPEEYSERLEEQNCSTLAQRHTNRGTSVSSDVYSSLFFGNGPKVHVAVGCDYCGMSPIIGERYKCKDCVEKIGFDLCESCYKCPAKIPGRFNQQHKPDHQFEVMQPLSIHDLMLKLNSEQSDDDDDGASDATEHMDGALTLLAGVRLDEGNDGSEEPEDISPLIFSVDVSLDQEGEADDPSGNISSGLT